MIKNELLLSGFELLHKGKFQEAYEIAYEVLNGDPENDVAFLLFGDCCMATGYVDQAVSAYKNSVRINPTSKDALTNLAQVLKKQGGFLDAVGVYKKLWDLDRANTKALLAMSELLIQISAWDEAKQTLHIALKINPNLSTAHVLLARLSREQNIDLVDAVNHCRRAIEIDNKKSSAYTEMGVALLRAGEVEEAYSIYKKNLEICPKDNSQGYSNWLFSQQFLEDLEPQTIFKNHSGWQNYISTDLQIFPQKAFNNTPDTNRKLKVGFASADLHTHSVSYFLQGLFQSYDRSSFEFTCFSNRDPRHEDKTSKALKALVDNWVIIAGMSPKDVHSLIRKQEIDLLIDLNGHAGRNILTVFYQRAAPVQITWLGYPDTTGLESIDYRIVDSITDPEPTADQFASEQIYRIPGPFLCYKPTEESAELDTKSKTTPEKIVFGCFNKVAKFSNSTLDIWSEILRQVPNAELLLKCQSFVEPKTRAKVFTKFQEHGIDPERVKYLSFLPTHQEHMSAYNLMDLALDTFPYNGTTTSCEALWMGVPVITKEGNRHASRVGMTILRSVGLDDWITYSNEEYIKKAIEMATNRAQLMVIKSTLRQRMQNSPLCDHVGFARKFEIGLREMWKSWCEEK